MLASLDSTVSCFPKLVRRSSLRFNTSQISDRIRESAGFMMLVLRFRKLVEVLAVFAPGLSTDFNAEVVVSALVSFSLWV